MSSPSRGGSQLEHGVPRPPDGAGRRPHAVGRATHDGTERGVGDDHEADETDRGQDERGAPHRDEPLERHTGRSADVAPGADEVVDRCAEGRTATGEVQEPRGGDEDEHRAHGEAHGATGADATDDLTALVQALTGAAHQQRTDQHERRRHEVRRLADQRAGTGGEALAHGSRERGVQTEAHEDADHDEGDAPHIVAVAVERLLQAVDEHRFGRFRCRRGGAASARGGGLRLRATRCGATRGRLGPGRLGVARRTSLAPALLFGRHVRTPSCGFGSAWPVCTGIRLVWGPEGPFSRSRKAAPPNGPVPAPSDTTVVAQQTRGVEWWIQVDPGRSAQGRERQPATGPWSRQVAVCPVGMTSTRRRRPQVGHDRGGSSSRLHERWSHPPAALPHQRQKGSGPASVSRPESSTGVSTWAR